MKISALAKIGKVGGMTLGGFSVPGILIRIGVELVLSVAVTWRSRNFRRRPVNRRKRRSDIA